MGEWFKKFFTDNAWVIMVIIVTGIWFGGSQFTTYTTRIERNTDALEKISAALVHINDLTRRMDKVEATQVMGEKYWSEFAKIIKSNTEALHDADVANTRTEAKVNDLVNRVARLEER